MIPFFEGLLQKDVELFLTTCNPTTVRDEVVEYLRSAGARVVARRGMSKKELEDSYHAAIEWGPSHLCEMGADLSRVAAGRLRPGILAGLEATGSGITALNNIDLPYPVFNWDDLPVKEGLHNRYMVGLSVWQAFCNRTGLSLHGMKVLVVGFGSVGRGVAEAARAFGGTVSVAEVDGARRMEATYGGWPTGELKHLVGEADVVATATGVAGVVGRSVIDSLKPGAFLVNAGHAAHEIDVAALQRFPSSPAVPFVTEYTRPGGKPVYLFADGAMANLTAGEGDSINSFDLTLAVLTAAIIFVSCEGTEYPPGLHPLPPSVWRPVVY